MVRLRLPVQRVHDCSTRPVVQGRNHGHRLAIMNQNRVGCTVGLEVVEMNSVLHVLLVVKAGAIEHVATLDVFSKGLF